MLFNSLEFLVFMAALLPLYAGLRRHLELQNLLLLGASYFFYGFWDWRFLGLLVGATVVVHGCTVALARSEDPRRRRLLLLAPIVALLLGVAEISVPWETLLLSVGLYVVIPLIAGIIARRMLMANGGLAAVDSFMARIKPASVIGLLATVVLLFGFQGGVILANPLIIALIAVPILIQSYGIFALAYAAAFAWKVPHRIAAPCALIGTSNFFELAVAVAISLFGLNSGAALATVVGVLVEVPVMLSLVAFANRTRVQFAAFETEPS